VHAVDPARGCMLHVRDAADPPRGATTDGAKTLDSAGGVLAVYDAGGEHAVGRHEHVECLHAAIVHLAALPWSDAWGCGPGGRVSAGGERTASVARTARSIAPGVPATRASDGNVGNVRCCGSPAPSSATGAISSAVTAAALRVDLRREDATRCCTASSSGSTDVSRVDIRRRVTGVSMARGLRRRTTTFASVVSGGCGRWIDALDGGGGEPLAHLLMRFALEEASPRGRTSERPCWRELEAALSLVGLGWAAAGHARCITTRR